MIKSLTALRGIFILFIFFHHCLDLYQGGGTLAVTFFFILGGFCMTLGYKDKVLNPSFSYIKFIKGRCSRFFPLHWLCLVASIPLIILFHAELRQLWIFPVNALLLQSWIPIKDVYFSYNWVSWYLADTMFFSVMFPYFLRMILTLSNKGKIVFSVLITVLYILLALLLPVEKYHSFLYISPIIRSTDFILGIFLAMLFLRLKENPVKWATKTIMGQLISVVLVVLLVVESCLLPEIVTWFAPVYWILVCLLILIASLSCENGGGKFWENKLLQRLGELSFPIFLIHQLVLRYSSLIFEKLLHIDNKLIFIVYTLTVTVVLSYLVDYYILKTITQWIKRKFQTSMTALS